MSFQYNMAEGLKIPRFLEASPDLPVVFPVGLNVLMLIIKIILKNFLLILINLNVIGVELIKINNYELFVINSKSDSTISPTSPSKENFGFHFNILCAFVESATRFTDSAVLIKFSSNSIKSL